MAVDTQKDDLDEIDLLELDLNMGEYVATQVSNLIVELRAARAVIEAITPGYYDESPNPLCCACHNSPHTPDCPLAAYLRLVQEQGRD